MKRLNPAIIPFFASGILGVLIVIVPARAPSAAPGSATPPGEPGSYREVVKQIVPAVVSIESAAMQTKPGSGRPRDDDPYEDFRKFFEQPGSKDEDSGQFGSGFLVDPKGLVVTNFHVVEGAEKVEVRLNDGRKFLSSDIKADPKTDLAIVRIQARAPLPFLEFGASEEMEIGDRVLAVGAPFGLTGSVTHGIISGKGRSLKMNLYEDYLQTDAPINPGNSGGPLVNLEGKVIGITAAIKSKSGGFQGVGLAIPSSLASGIVAQLAKDGTVRRGFLGVQMNEISDREVAARLGADQGGVVTSLVFANSPAARAGVKEGDVIVGINGKAIREGRDLQSAIAQAPLGKPSEVKVVRDGKIKELEVVIEEQPKEFGNPLVPAPRPPKTLPDAISLNRIGIDLADLTADLAEKLGYREGLAGALITRARRDGSGAESGLHAGMVITKIDRQPVRSTAQCKELFANARLDEGVLVQIHTPQGGANFVIVRENK